MKDDDVIAMVRSRYRICNYLFRLGIGWFMVGVTLDALPHQLGLTWNASMVELVGGGIFTAAAALTFAIYRCPVCDHFLNRFRPRKDQCGNCGAKIR